MLLVITTSILLGFTIVYMSEPIGMIAYSGSSRTYKESASIPSPSAITDPSKPTTAASTTAAVETIPTPVVTATVEATPIPDMLQLIQIANLRQAPGVQQPVLLTIQKGAEVIVFGETRSLPDGSVWVNVRSGQIAGWMNRLVLR